MVAEFTEGEVFALSTASCLQGKANERASAEAKIAAKAVAESTTAADLDAEEFILVSCTSLPSKGRDGWAKSTSVVEGRLLQALREEKDKGIVFSLAKSATTIQFDSDWVVEWAIDLELVVGGEKGIDLEVVGGGKKKRKVRANTQATEKLLSFASHASIIAALGSNMS